MPGRLKKTFKWLGYLFVFFIILLLILGILFLWAIKINPPEVEDMSTIEIPSVKVDEEFHYWKNCWLKKNKHGIWETYLEGSPFEIGVANGKMTSELTYQLEVSFINEMKKFVPSESFLHYLKYFIGWFNRKMPEYILEEYQQEIYGASLSANNEYDFVGPKYQRVLNYHGAHDIGHALKNMGTVGCTSFSTWNTRSEDSTLLIGRNFDFYVGDGFSKNKVVSFIRPEKGNPFMMIAWAGMSGVVSGMNIHGLTITLNAAPSEIPMHGKTPISILAREILQYASNIEEAYAIAQKRETFVSETLMIGSAVDNATALIEKSTEKTVLYHSELNDHIICSNHYQSEAFKDYELNTEHIKNSHSDYRYKRMIELMNQYPAMNAEAVAAILRDKEGIGGQKIGMGNEKSINQLIAHHAIIFKPHERIVWVSTPPFMLGEFIAYDLNQVFSEFPGMKENREITLDSLEIAEDPFLYSEEFNNFKTFRQLKEQVEKAIESEGKIKLEENTIRTFIQSNPDYYMVYSLSGEYYLSQKECEKALEFYQQALEKEITTLTEKEEFSETISAGCTLE